MIAASAALGVIAFMNAAFGVRFLAGAFFAAFLAGAFLAAAFLAGAFFAGAFLAGAFFAVFFAAFFAVAMLILSINGLVDVLGVGESRVDFHFSCFRARRIVLRV